MDWSSHDHRPTGRRASAGPALAHTYWRVTGPSGKILTCALYRTAAGFFEVRCGYSLDDVVRSQVVRTHAGGNDVAAIWRLAVLKKGFRELDPTD